MARIAVIIPVFGRQELTHALLEDINKERGLVEVYIVDNRGDYERRFDEKVLCPGRNLGWLRGTNYGASQAAKKNFAALVFLNNDTRLSLDFFAGLKKTQEETKAGLVAPLYDDPSWKTQLSAVVYKDASSYQPVKLYREVWAVDGTCVYLPGEIYRRVGSLDETHFGRFGWGADIDYSLRVRSIGRKIVVTGLSYLHHERKATLGKIRSFVYYDWVAGRESNRGMTQKYGRNWKGKALCY